MQSDQLQSQQTMSCIKFPLITELVHFANAEKAEVKISMFYLKLIVFDNPVINRLDNIAYNIYFRSSKLFVTFLSSIEMD